MPSPGCSCGFLSLSQGQLVEQEMDFEWKVPYKGERLEYKNDCSIERNCVLPKSFRIQIIRPLVSKKTHDDKF